MKLTITFVSLIMSVAAPVFAGEVVVQSSRTVAAEQLAHRAFNSCVQAFVERIFPGQEINLRTKLNQGSMPKRLSYRKAEERSEPKFALQARLKRDNSMMAKAECATNREAQVVNISVDAVAAAKLAGLTPRDVQLAMVSR